METKTLWELCPHGNTETCKGAIFTDQWIACPGGKKYVIDWRAILDAVDAFELHRSEEEVLRALLGGFR